MNARFFQSTKAAVVTCLAASALLLVVYTVATPPAPNGKATKPGNRVGASSSRSATGGAAGVSTTGNSVAPGRTPPTGVAPGAPGGPTTTAAPSPVPAEIRITGNTNVKDGGLVNVHVTAKTGSQVFGFEARLCAGDATFQFDSDFRPTQGGQCVPKPLSAGSDFFQEIRASPPYAVAETSFRVGVGTEQFKTESGQAVTITCGPSHPCRIAVKIQYPGGFAFRSYPVTYG